MWQHQAPKGTDEVVDVDLDQIYQDCVSQVANNDYTKPTAATAAFLEKLVGPDSKVSEVYVYGLQAPNSFMGTNVVGAFGSRSSA